MKTLTVGIFHDDALGPELGKKGTLSDMAFFNRKTPASIITFMQPLQGKLSAKAEIISTIDAAIVSFAQVTPELGETVLMLDSMGVSKGIAVVPANSDIRPVAQITKGTSLESFVVKDNNPHQILEALEAMENGRSSAAPAVVVADHSFSVKGVGEVVLAFVKKGTIKKFDKLMLMPAGKEVIVRSIQMHDDDFDEAAAGSRVGLCIKGAMADEMRRGSVLAAPGAVKVGQKLKLSFQPNRFYGPAKEGPFHVSVGMQTIPAKLSAITADSITIEADKPFAYSPEDTFLLLDLNAKKLRIIGKGKAAS